MNKYFLSAALVFLSAPVLAQKTVTLTRTNGTSITVDLVNVADISFSERPSLATNKFALNESIADISGATQKVDGSNTVYKFTIDGYDTPLVVTIPTAKFGYEIDLSEEDCPATVAFSGKTLSIKSGTVKLSRPKFGTNLILALNATDGNDRFRASYNNSCSTEYSATNTYKLNIDGDYTGTLSDVYRYVDNNALSTSIVFGTKLNPTDMADLKNGLYTVIVKVSKSKIGSTLNLATDVDYYSLTVYNNEKGCLHVKGQEVSYSTITGTLSSGQSSDGKMYMSIDATLDGEKTVYADLYNTVEDVTSVNPVLPAAPEDNTVDGIWVEIPSTHEMQYNKTGFYQVMMKENYNKTKRTFTFMQQGDTQYTSGLPKLVVTESAEEALMEEKDFDIADVPEDSWSFSVSNIDIYAVTHDEWKSPYAPTTGTFGYSIDTANKTFRIKLVTTDPLTQEDIRLYYEGSYE